MELEAIADKILVHIDKYCDFRNSYLLIRPNDDNDLSYLFVRYKNIDNVNLKYEKDKFSILIEACDGSTYESEPSINSIVSNLSDNEVKKTLIIVRKRFIDKLLPFIDKAEDILSEINDKLEALVFAPESSFFKEFMAARTKLIEKK